MQTFALGAQWPTIDPFLFVAHHKDDYPNANSELGPDADLSERSLGQDFSARDGWSMYHGADVPGFPQHPHRGFETVTHVRRGVIDHADSLGATARFGHGDTQWMTAGRGVQHSEMFPLTETTSPNPMEMFQIWVNLPATQKMVDPYFTMFWNERTPRLRTVDQDGAATEVTVIAGELGGLQPQTPPPDSWASDPDSDLAIWHIKIDPNGRWTLPAASSDLTKGVLYAFADSTVRIGGAEISAGTGAVLDRSHPAELVAGPDGIECVLLQGRPIDEPVARYGPFVMNTNDEIHDAISDYQSTQFGGWPWPDAAPNHGADADRFAIHADGRREQPISRSPAAPR